MKHVPEVVKNNKSAPIINRDPFRDLLSFQRGTQMA